MDMFYSFKEIGMTPMVTYWTSINNIVPVLSHGELDSPTPLYHQMCVL